MSKKPFMNVLEDIEDSDDSQASGSQSDEEKPETKKSKKEVTIEQLERAGYNAGPSVLYLKPPAEDANYDMKWSDGKAAKERETEDTYEDRQHTQQAASTAVEESAGFAMKAVAHAAHLRQQAIAEKEELRQNKRLTFNQKEKRKRDAGQATRGKNFVEEEKRMAREFKQYSGFD